MGVELGVCMCVACVCLSVCLSVVFDCVCTCVWCVSVCVCVCVYVSDTDLRYYYWWGAIGYRGSCIYEDRGEEMVTGGTVGFCVEVGGVIICVALAENY